MLRIPATLWQRVQLLLGCLLLCECTPIRVAERFSLEGYWRTEGYTCQGESLPLLVRLAHDGAALAAYRQHADPCGTQGEISWLGEFAGGELRKAALPITFKVLVNVHIENEGIRPVAGTANVVETNELIIRMSNGARYTLVRDFEIPSSSEPMDTANRTGASQETEEPAEVEPKLPGGDRAKAGAKSPNIAGRPADDNIAGARANAGGSDADAGMRLTAAGRGGTSGVTAAADSGMPIMTPATLPEAGADTQPPQPDAGTSEPAPEPDAGMGAPASTEPRTTDRWYCIDSTDGDGRPYCNCTVSSVRHTDTCTLPKPTCCFTFNDVLEQCLCYLPDSSACESFMRPGGVGAGTPIVTCPP